MAEKDREPLEERDIGPVTVLFGERGGKYPDGNSILVRGTRETAIIDPALGVVAREGQLPRIDRVLNSHCHEDHIAGNHVFPDQPWHCHEEDAVGFRSLDDMMAIYGYPGAIDAGFRKLVVERFHYTARDVEAFAEGDVFDMGGVRAKVVHTPGHTRGHSCFLLEWGSSESERLLFLGDIELTSFGPYYGDAWSDLESFERSLKRVRDVEAGWYATFHHIGVLEREPFLERLDRFEAKIAERESRLIEFLAEPHTLDEIIAHRFVYRPQDAVPNAEPVERRSMGMHVERLLGRGDLEETEAGRYVRS